MRAFTSCVLALVFLVGTVSQAASEFEFDENPMVSVELPPEAEDGFFSYLSSVALYGGLGIFTVASLTFCYRSYKTKTA